jgi:hypothetical protein
VDFIDDHQNRVGSNMVALKNSSFPTASTRLAQAIEEQRKSGRGPETQTVKPIVGLKNVVDSPARDILCPDSLFNLGSLKITYDLSDLGSTTAAVAAISAGPVNATAALPAGTAPPLTFGAGLTLTSTGQPAATSRFSSLFSVRPFLIQGM